MESRNSLPGRLALRRMEILFGISLLGLLLLTCLLYWPGLTGPLLMDDYGNLGPLGDNGGVRTFDAFRNFVFGNSSGPTGRPVAMLSFLLDAQNWPPPIPALKYTNLMIHLLCGISICWMSFLLAQLLGLTRLQGSKLALLVAGIWLIHPVNVSTTLYVIQRMTQLMTLFATLSIVFYLMGRRAMEAGSPRSWVFFCCALFPFGLLSVLSKENGALLLLLIVSMERLFFSKRDSSEFFKMWYQAGVIIPVLLIVGYLIISAPANFDLYQVRHFNVVERLLTETRVLSIYLLKIVLPNLYRGGLFNDDFEVSLGLFNPITTLTASVFILALIGSAYHFRRKHPVYSFAVAWFFVMHILESTYLPLELYFEHRNYLAMVGPLFAIGWYVIQVIDSTESIQRIRAVRAYLVILVSLSIWVSWQLTNVWRDEDVLLSYWSELRPGSVRAQLTYAERLQNLGLAEQAMEHLQLAHEQHPEEVTIKLFIWNLACQSGIARPFDLQDLINDPNLSYNHDIISTHLSRFLANLVQGRCGRPERETVIGLYERIGELPMDINRRRGYHVRFSEIYAFFGEPELAIEQLDYVLAISPQVQYRVQQARIATLAGFYNDALTYLGLARLLDSDRSPLLPSQEESIDAIEDVVIALM